jgi:hypothetical protein
MFQTLEPWMRQIERNGDSRDAVGAEPLVGKPKVRAKDEPAPFQFRVELRDTRLEFGALNAQTEVADPRIEQPLTGQGYPGKTAPTGPPGRTAGAG